MYLVCADRDILFSESKRNFLPLRCRKDFLSLTSTAFCQLRTAVHFQLLTEPQAKQVLAHTTAVIAIRHGDRYVGITRILFDYGTDAYLTDVIVHPDYQGQGIGGLLVKNALAYLQTHVQPGVRIACSLYANPGKEPFYAAYGFQLLPNAQYGHGMLLELS